MHVRLDGLEVRRQSSRGEASASGSCCTLEKRIARPGHDAAGERAHRLTRALSSAVSEADWAKESVGVVRSAVLALGALARGWNPRLLRLITSCHCADGVNSSEAELAC